MKRLVVLLLLLFAAAPADAAEELSLDELLARFGWDLATAEIRTEKVADGLYVLFGIGGNIAVSIGEQGVLIVDDQFPELMPKIEAAIAKVGGKASTSRSTPTGTSTTPRGISLSARREPGSSARRTRAR